MGGMGEEGVKLIGAWFSPFVRRVEWGLKLKGIEYEYLEENLLNKSPLLLRSNPVNQRVPVLLHRGKCIPESLVIIEYLDHVWKLNPLLPTDPLERASVRFLAKFANEEFTEVVRQTLHYGGEQQRVEREKAVAALEVLEVQLVDGRKFFGGEKMGLVDLVLGWMPYWLDPIEEVAGVKVFDASKHTRIDKWMKTMAEVPLIKENVPPRHQLVRCFKIIRLVKGLVDTNSTSNVRLLKYA